MEEGQDVRAEFMAIVFDTFGAWSGAGNPSGKFEGGNHMSRRLDMHI